MPDCTTCQGSGFHIDEPCGACDGTGRAKECTCPIGDQKEKEHYHNCAIYKKTTPPSQETRDEGECQACKLGDKAAYPGVHSGTFCVLPGSPKANDRIKRLKRRAEHLRERVDVRKESYDKAELSALDWAIDKLANYESDMEDHASTVADKRAIAELEYLLKGGDFFFAGWDGKKVDNQTIAVSKSAIEERINTLKGKS